MFKKVLAWVVAIIVAAVLGWLLWKAAVWLWMHSIVALVICAVVIVAVVYVLWVVFRHDDDDDEDD